MIVIENLCLDIESLRTAYLNQVLTPESMIDYLIEKSEKFNHYNIWITQLTREEIQTYLNNLSDKSPKELPLYGIPFVIKDNIDLAGFPTTAACPEFGYTPEKNAYIVDQLINAGAIPLGKSNMDQFATGLVGTRTPYGECCNAFNPEYISGGSSSGSAVAVALGLASFSLGTDTAGSGRVPAMLNNLYGLKPSRGLFSMDGVIPACKSLDCPSVFALSSADAATVFNCIIEKNDDIKNQDSYLRKNTYLNSKRYTGVPELPPSIAVPQPDNLEFFGNQQAEKLFNDAVEIWKNLGAEVKLVDITPMLEAAKLLYEGPWVAERYLAIEAILNDNPEAVHPVVRDIIETATTKTAADAFRYEYKMQNYRKIANTLFNSFDFLMHPTAPTTYTIEQLLNDPISLNSNIGYYTNYMNLLDLCGIAVPVGEMNNNQQFGVTLVGKALSEQKLLGYAHQWQKSLDKSVGATGKKPDLPDWSKIPKKEMIDIAVCGAHLSGMPLNWQLVERGATLKIQTQSTDCYRMYVLEGGPPFRPGLVKDNINGSSIEVEVWSMPAEEFGSFVANIPRPLGIGKLELKDGSEVSGFICEPYGVQNAKDITDLGSWRKYISSLNQ